MTWTQTSRSDHAVPEVQARARPCLSQVGCDVAMKQSPEHVRKRVAAGLATRAANKKPFVRKPCEVDGCGGLVRAKGLCNKHYLRHAIHGQVDLPKRDASAYLSGRSAQVGECLVWQLKSSKAGYGIASFAGQQYPAHVLSWMTANGTQVPDGRQINHRCHNRACINPEHLYAGTQKQNMADMIAAGRCNYARGERVGAAKLDAAKVEFIRRSIETHAALARQFSVSQSLVRAVRQHLVWRHVDAK